MKASRQPMTREDIEARTAQNRRIVADVIKRGQAMQYDEERFVRLKASLCMRCYYAGSSIAGRAITTRACGVCNYEVTYSSTHTDALCESCATEHDLCKHCGSDRELRTHRRKYAFTVTPEEPDECPGCKYVNRDHRVTCQSESPSVMFLPSRGEP